DPGKPIQGICGCCPGTLQGRWRAWPGPEQPQPAGVSRSPARARTLASASATQPGCSIQGRCPAAGITVTSADGISAAVCCPWLTGRGLCAPRTKATGTLMAPGDPAKPAARCPATEATVPAQAASET